MNTEQPKQQTAVEWLIEKLNSKYGNDDFIITHINEIEQAKQMEKEQIENTRPQIISNCVIKEISDEEIEKAIIDQDIVKQKGYCHCFLEGAKWYREQLKKR